MQLLESQKGKYEDKIRRLEKEIASKPDHTTIQDKISQTSRQINDNKEIIRLRRLSDEQADEIQRLKIQTEASINELVELREALKNSTANGGLYLVYLY